jgi:hypothetical protein
MRRPTQTPITVCSEIRGPLVAMMAFWLLAVAVVAVFASALWLLALATGGVIGSLIMLAWALWPRRGDLVRLIIDPQRRLIYWAHRGCETEEVPFSSLRAIVLESSHSRRYARLWATERCGRRVPLGSGMKNEMEAFALDLAEAVGTSVWYKDGEMSHPAAIHDRPGAPGRQRKE